MQAESPAFTMHLDIVILSSAIIPDTAKRDQSSLDFFEFGESILVVAYLMFGLGSLTVK
jgi:hypothetical protein